MVYELISDQKKVDESIACYRKAIELDPNLFPAHFNLGNGLASQGKLDAAIACYRRASELDPHHANVRMYLADTLAKKGWNLVKSREPERRHPVRAVAAANEAIELDPRSSFAWQYLGLVQYRIGNWQASIEALEKSCKLQEGGTGDAFQWLFLAMAHWQLGDKDEARKWYDKSIQVERVMPEELRRFRAEAEELLKITDEKPTAQPPVEVK